MKRLPVWMRGAPLTNTETFAMLKQAVNYVLVKLTTRPDIRLTLLQVLPRQSRQWVTLNFRGMKWNVPTPNRSDRRYTPIFLNNLPAYEHDSGVKFRC